MSTHADSKPWTVPALAEAKRNGQKLVMLTAYDASFARTFDANGVDLILIGDSLGMVVQGHDSTLPVTVAEMVYHTGAVARVVQRALLIADLPFGADATDRRSGVQADRVLTSNSCNSIAKPERPHSASSQICAHSLYGQRRYCRGYRGCSVAQCQPGVLRRRTCGGFSVIPAPGNSSC